jgi:hypothetical protein
MMHYKPISVEELIAAVQEWAIFWGPPYMLRDSQDKTKNRAWLRAFLKGLNSSVVARKYWAVAKDKVFGTCDRFPWPKDVIAAACMVCEERDVAIDAEHAGIKAKSATEQIADPATDEHIRLLVESFRIEPTKGE